MGRLRKWLVEPALRRRAVGLFEELEYLLAFRRASSESLTELANELHAQLAATRVALQRLGERFQPQIDPTKIVTLSGLLNDVADGFYEPEGDDREQS